jgi:hypothetical protein
MSAANDIDFAIAFRRARAEYDEEIQRRLRAVFSQTDDMFDSETSRDIALEEHIRAYVIDPLLAALNWQIGKNTIIEAFLRDQQTHTRRRLDYLGHEVVTNRPLLIVEAKRPDAQLPGIGRTGGTGGAYLIEELIVETLYSLKGAGAQMPPIVEQSLEWLSDIQNYYIHEAESYFSRLRRCEFGIHHRISGQHLQAYAREIAWREDNRRVANGTQWKWITAAALAHPKSATWTGYWHREKAA